MTEQFKLIKQEKKFIFIENTNYKIKIYIEDIQSHLNIVIYYKISGRKRVYYKSKLANTIPYKYRDIIDNFLVLHKLTL